MPESQTLHGTVQQVIEPDELDDYALGEPLRVVADENHLAVIDDTDYYDDSLKTRIISTLLFRHIDPPPSLVVTDPPFAEGDEIRVEAKPTHLEKVFVAGREDVVARAEGDDSLET